ncbi:hypothetical protein EPI10_014393 [Gossypium australe]|uniref:Uncharacterized protein n=1 Tax=Gossypium australe TaxID=47621 RepID=A0A5B6VH14_9ROSI|nr:hypothetical protein EPI10_014393 [Gossypium australe]
MHVELNGNGGNQNKGENVGYGMGEHNLFEREVRQFMESKKLVHGVETSNMDLEKEDDPLNNEEGKKRQRFASSQQRYDSDISMISNSQDLMEVYGGLSAHNQQISAVARGQADRKQ